MPYNKFILDSNDPVIDFKKFVEYIYGGDCFIESKEEDEAKFFLNVPGELSREEFESDMKEWCEEHDCSFELVNQTPEAPSPQFFSENMKLMYPRVKNYEALEKNPRKLEVAKTLWKKNWPTEFNENEELDREDIVLLYNEYMEELSEWKPVELKLKFNEVNEEK